MSARVVTLDCETIPCQLEEVREQLRRETDAARPAQNRAKADKEVWDTPEGCEARFQTALAKTAVDPLFCGVLCVSWAVDDERPQTIKAMPWSKRREARMAKGLAQTWAEAADVSTVWCGHNLCGFDLRVLLALFRRTGVRPPEHFPRWYAGRWHGRTHDSMLEAACGHPLNFISLESACRAVGVSGAKTIVWNGEAVSGERVQEMYEGKAYREIVKYCEQDVRVTRALYQAQTFRGTYPGGRLDGVVAQLEEIDGSNLSDAQMALAKLRILESSGVVPRT